MDDHPPALSRRASSQRARSRSNATETSKKLGQEIMLPALVYSVHLGLSIDADYTARQKREACSVPLALGEAGIYGVLPDSKSQFSAER